MNNPIVDIHPTIDFQDQINDFWRSNPSYLKKLTLQAESNLYHAGVCYDSNKPLKVKTTTLVLTKLEQLNMMQLAEELHQIIELAIDWLLEPANRLFPVLFGHYSRYVKYFKKAPGQKLWQRYSRYDAVITSEGTLKFIELNTSCPAGFILSPNTCHEVNSILSELGLFNGYFSATVQTQDMIKLMQEIYHEHHGMNHCFALLYDRNKITNELMKFKELLELAGVPAEVGDIKDCVYQGNKLYLQGRPISATYNKIRIANTENSEHCWTESSISLYSDYLNALLNDDVNSLNNLCTATISEDKSILQVLHEPLFQERLTIAQINLINQFIPWTTSLYSQESYYQGDRINNREFLVKNKDRLILKPSNQSRGRSIFLGRQTTLEDWSKLLVPSDNFPLVVQEYVEPFKLNICDLQTGDTKASEVIHQETLAMSLLNGKCKGFISRAAPGSISSVSNQGVTQSVIVKE